jgi:hypothetical protein
VQTVPAMAAHSGGNRSVGRVMGFIALAVVIGVATGLVLHRVVVGMLVGGGVLILGLLIIINRAGSPRPER